jgi:RNA recognition motif-containing protein
MSAIWPVRLPVKTFRCISHAGEVRGALAFTDKASGRCRGFGFVEMAELADVALAFSLLNNTLLNGQQIKIEPHPALRNGKARKSAIAG